MSVSDLIELVEKRKLMLVNAKENGSTMRQLAYIRNTIKIAEKFLRNAQENANI